MDEKLKEMLDKLQVKFDAQKTELEELTKNYMSVKNSHDELATKIGEGGDSEKFNEQIEELKNELSDITTKFNKALSQPVIEEGAEKNALKELVVKSFGSWISGSKSSSSKDFIEHVKSFSEGQFKAVNITNAADGGLAVAEVLFRDVIEYAREFSPIVSLVKFMPAMTRNFREMVLVSYPSTQEGIENVAGTAIAETTTPTYKEVKSKEFKINAKPRITDEAMYGADIDIYGKLVELLGIQLGVALAAQILYGNGADKNARGILSSNRLDITDGTGESWKPTLAANPANARSADFFPAIGTGVSASLGLDFEAICDYVIDVCNFLPTMYLQGAEWVMNRKTKGLFEKVRNKDGDPIFRNGYINGVNVLLLNGYPVRLDDTYPDVAADKPFATFGRLDRAFAINNGDVNKMLLDPYSVDGCTVIKTDKEYFEMIQNSDAIVVCVATANAGA